MNEPRFNLQEFLEILEKRGSRSASSMLLPWIEPYVGRTVPFELEVAYSSLTLHHYLETEIERINQS